MEELIKQVALVTTKEEKQALAALIIAAIPDFLNELGDIEQRYNKGLKQAADMEGAKTRAEMIMGETDLYKEFKKKKRLYEHLQTTLSVLNMYTGS